MQVQNQCPICNNESVFKFRKNTTDYYQCTNCKTIFCGELDNDNLVGGGAHEERNALQNHLRIDRIKEISMGMLPKEVHILDFGCGFGRLVDDLKAAGFVNTVGYDSYNPDFQKLPEKNKFHICISVEVFEHLSPNFIEIDVIHRSLRPGGVCIVETGYLNAAWEDGVSDETNPYINPAAGHSTIYTHHGIDLLMALRGFNPVQKFNRHCHLYQKKL